MPVFEQGRFVSSSSEQLTEWLSSESGRPLHVVTPETDLVSELKRGIAFARGNKKKRRSVTESLGKLLREIDHAALPQ